MVKSSIIIPVYNGKTFILNAINSILNQTFADFEIIIIDDCSNDGTSEIVVQNFPSLIGEKIKISKNSENKERSFSRNRGAKLAQGEYLFYLDYDDEWEKDYIESILNIFETKNPDIVFSFPRTHINQDGEIIKQAKKKLPKMVEELLFSGEVGYPSGCAFKKDCFKMYDKELTQREDWELLLRSYLQGLNLVINDNNKVKIRSHQGRTSKNPSFANYTLMVYKKHIKKIPAKYRSIFLFHIGDTCFRYGYMREGWTMVFKAFINNPLLFFKPKKTLSLLKRGLRIDRYFLKT